MYSPWPQASSPHAAASHLYRAHTAAHVAAVSWGTPPPAMGRRDVLRFTSQASRPLATHPAKEKEKENAKNITPALRYGSWNHPIDLSQVMQ